jgi:hypothetical protein
VHAIEPTNKVMCYVLYVWKIYLIGGICYDLRLVCEWVFSLWGDVNEMLVFICISCVLFEFECNLYLAPSKNEKKKMSLRAETNYKLPDICGHCYNPSIHQSTLSKQYNVN